MEVTLASYNSDEAPDSADFMAQSNQIGSGTEDEAQLLTTDVETIFQSNDIKDAQLIDQVASAPREYREQQAVVTSVVASRNINQATREDFEDTPLPDGELKPLLQRSLEMASLEAKLDSIRQTLAKSPRITRVTASSTLASTDAYYINQWRRKIEDMGALNYPPEARSCFNNCRLRLLVAIHPDGSLAELSVLQSSGRKVLDEAAMRIVRMASPFAPFSAAMRKNTDRLEIIRTWTFTGNQYLSGTN